jgi:hypothetical protein
VLSTPARPPPCALAVRVLPLRCSLAVHALQPTELFQASVVSGCVSPPCAIGGVPAPEVHYSFNQPVTPVEPHPLTLAAVQKAADALAQAQKAGDKEADNRKEIDKVGLGEEGEADGHADLCEVDAACTDRVATDRS